MSAPDKDLTVLTKYKQACLTSVIKGDLSKHLPEKWKVVFDIPKAAQVKTAGKKKKKSIAKHCISSKVFDAWRREIGK